MKPKQLPDSEIDNILQSLDGLKAAEPKPFLYTRVMTRLQPETNSGSLKKWSSLAIASLSLLILLNTYLAMVPMTTSAAPDAELQRSFVDEYGLEESGSPDDYAY